MGVVVVNPDGIHKTTTYFQASIASGTRFICLAGQLAVDAQGRLVGHRDLAAQTQQAYSNVHIALKALGASFADIAKLTVYAVDLSPDKMEPMLSGAIRASEELGFDYRRPVTLIGVTALANPDCLVEVEALAIV